MVGHPSRDYLWILSRTPSLEQETLDRILAGLTEQGYPLDRLVLTPQLPPGTGSGDGRIVGPTARRPAMDFDYLLVGGGLQSGLVVQALRQLRPEARIALCERAPRLGGNHTWSFHEADVPPLLRAALEPLIVARWPGYDVHFPAFTRRVPEPYATITSERFDAVVRRSLEAPGCALLLGTRVMHASAQEVVLEDGRRLTAAVVIEARGPTALETPPASGFQKFVGLEVRLRQPSGFVRPVLMDATVPQRDGYRFVYVLPFADDHLLVEDTYYSDSPHLEVSRLRQGLLDWLAGRGLEVAEVIREEQGVLPLPLGAPRAIPQEDGPLLGGYQGGWFHPTTGYSLPVALRLAQHVATTPVDRLRGPGLLELCRQRERSARFSRLLNQLLFGAFPPHERWRVLERFYRLPDETVRRFYALDLATIDRLRILCGRPPRGLSATLALRSLRTTRTRALPEVR